MQNSNHFYQKWEETVTAVNKISYRRQQIVWGAKLLFNFGNELLMGNLDTRSSPANIIEIAAER